MQISTTEKGETGFAKTENSKVAKNIAVSP